MIDQTPETTILQRWRERYLRAADRPRRTGIELAPDEQGVQVYISARQQWERCLISFARYMDHPWSEIAPADFSPAGV